MRASPFRLTLSVHARSLAADAAGARVATAQIGKVRRVRPQEPANAHSRRGRGTLSLARLTLGGRGIAYGCRGMITVRDRNFSHTRRTTEPIHMHLGPAHNGNDWQADRRPHAWHLRRRLQVAHSGHRGGREGKGRKLSGLCQVVTSEGQRRHYNVSTMRAQ